MNPNPPDYAPDALVQNYLGANTWDPNQGGYARSLAATTTRVATWARDPAFIRACQQRLMEIQPELKTPALAEHVRINPSTGTDWGKVLPPHSAATSSTTPYFPTRLSETQCPTSLPSRPEPPKDRHLSPDSSRTA